MVKDAGRAKSVLLDGGSQWLGALELCYTDSIHETGGSNA